MKINKTNFKFTSLVTRNKTSYIILHHRAGDGDVQSIHQQHLSQGWSGIGYHYYVRKDGSIYAGRPENSIGAHCTNFNACSIGVCFEGDFDKEPMGTKQFNAGRELLAYLEKNYKNAQFALHKDFNDTDCPGKYFPYPELISMPEKELTSVNDIVWELHFRGVVSNKTLWLTKLKLDENCYWLARKYVNSKIKPTENNLTTINDIVWELHHKGIITNKDLWLKKLAKDQNAYWLARKMC